jgi:hypothetical protein
MTLTKTTGAGIFGGATTITSIDSPTRITITSTTANTIGSITFNAGGIASVLSVSNVSGLWVGAKVSIKSGTGQLAVEDTIITTIDSSVSNFTITPGSIVNLANATISLEADPKKESLDFEMFRVPISSRGYVNDQGVNKIVLTAQLPTEERYEFSEVGVYSAGSNSSAGQYDSKTITGFSADENWQLSVDNFLFGPSLIIPNETVPVFPDVQSSLVDGSNVMNVNRLAIKTSSTNAIFTNSARSSRYERPRFLNNVFMLKTESSQIFTTLQSESSVLQVQPGAKFLQLSGASIDLSRNSASDLIKLAFSLVSFTGNSPDAPDYARIVVEFANSTNSQVAQLQINASNARLNFSDNRYIVGEKRLDELFYNVGNQFSWRDVSVIRVYASATNRLATTSVSTSAGVGTITTGSNHNLAVNDYVAIFNVDSKVNGVRQVTAKTDTTFEFQIESLVTMTSSPAPLGLLEITNKNYYLALDALRLDNISTANPLYGLTGYSIIQNTDELTILKSPNTNNYVEYRFILDVT